MRGNRLRRFGHVHQRSVSAPTKKSENIINGAIRIEFGCK